MGGAMPKSASKVTTLKERMKVMGGSMRGERWMSEREGVKQ